MKKTNKKSLILFGALCGVMLAYQNCYELGGDTIQFSSGSQVEEDLELSPGGPSNERECVVGQRLFIGLDNDGGEPISGEIVSYSGNFSAAENYNYYSFSAHPIVGPQPKGQNINIFFYENSEGLYLNFFANKDKTGDNSWTDFSVDIDIQGNSINDGVIVSDDGAELLEVGSGAYEGRFSYSQNTDGGVIGPINISEDFTMNFQILDSGNVTNAKFYSANGSSFSLIKESQSTSSFTIYISGFEDCGE